MIKLLRIRTLLLVPVILFATVYLAGVIIVAVDDRTLEPPEPTSNRVGEIAIFGASGTAGDGILKAALADPAISKIRVFTRRQTPRMEAGEATGRVRVTQHLDYLDYRDIHDQLVDIDTVFWAIGVSSLGVDEATYGRIHVDFPLQFVREWTAVSDQPALSFHFISSSDISADSDTMWVREKIRAERSLFGFAEGTPLRVIAYRPDYIGPTAEQAHMGQRLLYWFFRPVGAAVKATEIGKAMLELANRGPTLTNGMKVSTAKIVGYSALYDHRQDAEGEH